LKAFPKGDEVGAGALDRAQAILAAAGRHVHPLRPDDVEEGGQGSARLAGDAAGRLGQVAFERVALVDDLAGALPAERLERVAGRGRRATTS
jgi:hypothetical protein